jgi:arginine utilization protein RocB
VTIITGSSALFGWMKDAVSSNVLLQKVKETAKSSVDQIVYTLDPQMKDYLRKYFGDLSSLLFLI